MPKRPPSPPSFSPPLPKDQYLVHLLSPQGSNNWLCEDPNAVERLVEVSSKLRRIKSLIIMRGDFAIISLFPSGPDKGGRLVGEILHIMDKGDIKEWKKAGAWPEGFGEKLASASAQEIQQSDSEDEGDEDEQEEDEGHQ
ncbi:hypothetical protein I302_104371 [Kwoniella bestiolae CBS 10118]|uniref:S1-like domain-containing protein n=1 Tax=Kwoniella bestiolae CBS 10118 TaxID=1296100 RepID=A0A1B9GB26_9TREE|nr:hypothetical protein I302_03079 [Kwoniella bestiolae CBS 10118]OCF28227.1 hypothetical protein I302_03079 [Kwoniella bestiolae CBS 10118]